MRTFVTPEVYCQLPLSCKDGAVLKRQFESFSDAQIMEFICRHDLPSFLVTSGMIAHHQISLEPLTATFETWCVYSGTAPKHRTVFDHPTLSEHRVFLKWEPIASLRHSTDSSCSHFSLLPGKKVLFNIDYLLDRFQLPRTASSSVPFFDNLIGMGVPEEHIVCHKELWNSLQQLERNDVSSKHTTFRAFDERGNPLLLKFMTDGFRARKEAAATHYLSDCFSSVPPSFYPVPYSADGFHLVVQHAVSPAPSSLSYWLAELAQFHEKGRSVLDRSGFLVPLQFGSVSFRSAAQEIERLEELVVDFPFDSGKYSACVPVVSSRGDLVHGDFKKDNRVGKYMVDFELLSTGHSGVDLGLLLAEYCVPVSQWGRHLDFYVRQRSDFDGSLDAFVDEVKQAAYVVLSREIIASSLRKPEYASTEREQRLATYLSLL